MQSLMRRKKDKQQKIIHHRGGGKKGYKRQLAKAMRDRVSTSSRVNQSSQGGTEKLKESARNV